MRRKIESDMVPIPSDWAGFISLEDNKTDLSLLLSNHLIDFCTTNNLIGVSGGYTESTMVKSSDPSLSVNYLMADHEEADTRLVLHSIHAHFEIVVVAANDTDVVLLLLAHFDTMNCTHLYMKSGTSKAPRYIPIHEISRMLPDEQRNTLLGFHAITCCDSVSQFSGHIKKTALLTFKQYWTQWTWHRPFDCSCSQVCRRVCLQNIWCVTC